MHCCQKAKGGIAQRAIGLCIALPLRLLLSHALRCRALYVLLLACCFAGNSGGTELAVAEEAFARSPSSQKRRSKHGRNMQATTSDAARREATQAVPLKNICPKYRNAVQKVLTDSSLYRRMPTQMVDCDPELFTFLMTNPEMLVEIWREMGISQVVLERTGADTFGLSDGAGTTGDLVIVEKKCDGDAQNRIVMFSEGAYEGKLFKRPVRAQCVLLLRSGSIRETNGRDYVACRLDTFVRIERTSIQLFAKAIHPWVGKTADANFADTISFISNFSQAAEQRPATIECLVNSLPLVTPQRQRDLINIAYDCSEKYGDGPAHRIVQKINVQKINAQKTKQ